MPHTRFEAPGLGGFQDHQETHQAPHRGGVVAQDEEGPRARPAGPAAGGDVCPAWFCSLRFLQGPAESPADCLLREEIKRFAQ